MDANQQIVTWEQQQLAELAHQLKTPLSAAILYMGHLAEQLKDQHPYTNWITHIQIAHASLVQQIEEFLANAKKDTILLDCLVVETWCEQLAKRVEPLLLRYAANFIINNQLQKSEIQLHNELFTGALLNLIVNALEAQANQIRLNIISLQGGINQFQLIDNGLGMTECIKEQAFTPFFTTKSQGTGLGLAVVQRVVTAHGGQVVLESIVGQGSCIIINLPELGSLANCQQAL